ncbi:MAG: hypothetical protein EBX57_01870, partial [Betaproteobacteria bacterium]|nr:hypothetical protein [Betaproteobacteria bacterium]
SPTAVTLACVDGEACTRLQRAFSTSFFRTYTNDDIAGVELGGALKNIFAIAAGVGDGLGLGDNSKAALVTRALAEMIRLGTALGGRRETFAGLSGIAPQRKSLRHLTDHGQTQTQGPRCRIAPDQLTTMRISQGK